ncbi:hypothetical protein [Okeania sp. SIO2C2]|nr:hypothetical protein [Okeania sp. SIO2C2]
MIFFSTIILKILLVKQSVIAVKEDDWDRFLEEKDFIEAVNQVE